MHEFHGVCVCVCVCRTLCTCKEMLELAFVFRGHMWACTWMRIHILYIQLIENVNRCAMRPLSAGVWRTLSTIYVGFACILWMCAFVWVCGACTINAAASLSLSLLLPFVCNVQQHIIIQRKARAIIQMFTRALFRPETLSEWGLWHKHFVLYYEQLHEL